MADVQVQFAHPWVHPDSGITYSTGQYATFDEETAKRLVFNGLAQEVTGAVNGPLIPPGAIDDVDLAGVLAWYERKVSRAGANPGYQVVLGSDGQTLVLQPNIGGGTGGEPTVVRDATGSVKGILRLTGDLGGSADSPTVPGLASKLDLEQVQDAVNDMLVAGGGIGKIYDDTTGKLTLSAFGGTGGGGTDPEVVRDAVAAALVAGAGILLSVDDTADTITITATGGAGGAGDPEVIRDTIAAALSAGDGIEILPSDETNVITIRATGAGGTSGVPVDAVDGGSPTSTYLDTPLTQAEFIRDTIASALRTGGGMTMTVDDTADTITLTSTGSTDPEIVRDTMATALVAGAGVTITPNDAGDTITITATGGDAEFIRDTIGATLIAGSGITVAVDDATNQIVLSSTGGGGGTLDAEGVRDTMAAALVAGGNITVTVDDPGNTLTIGTTATTNSPDSFLRDRGNHTGTQTAASISDLGSVVKAWVNAPGSATNPHTSSTAARNADFTVNFWSCWPSTPSNAQPQDQLLVPADGAPGPSISFLQQFDANDGQWTNDGTDAAIAWSSERFTSAPGSLKLTAGAGLSLRALSPKFPMSAGRTVTVTLRASTASVGRGIGLQYRLFDAGNSQVGSGQAAAIGSTTVVASTSGTFTSLAFTIVVPNGSSTQMDLLVTVSGVVAAGETVWLDDVTAG